MSDFSVCDADMQLDANRGALQHLWEELKAGHLQKAAKIYANDAFLYLPQYGTCIAGRADIAARGLLQPGEVFVKVSRIAGDGGIWACECETQLHQRKTLLVSIAEMHNGLILRETRYRVPVDRVARS